MSDSVKLTESEVQAYYQSRVPDLRDSGGEWRGPCPLHGSDHRSDALAINKATGAWFCHSGCGCGGNLFEFEKRFSDCDFIQALKNVGEIVGRDLYLVKTKGKLIKKYVYTDADGKPLFHILRYESKSFSAEQPDGTPHIKGIRRVLYNLPAVTKSPVVYVCEGEKDADALNALGLVATTCAFGACTWNKSYSQQLTGKRANIIPDADGKGRMHRDQVAQSLVGSATSIRIIDLPTEKNGRAVKDISNFIDAGGTREEIVALAEAAPEYAAPAPEYPAAPEYAAPTTENPAAPEYVAPAPENPPAAEERQDVPTACHPVKVFELADSILRDHYFAIDPGRRLYVYVNGVYCPQGERLIRREVKRILDAGPHREKWTIHRVREVIEYIVTGAADLFEEPPANIINVENGLLNVVTRELLPHTPEHRSPLRIPVTYDPQAKCPEAEKFVASVFPKDSVEIAWEIFSWVLTVDRTIQVSILLIGEGANGKSTFLELLRRLIGRINTVSMPLQRLEADRFAVASLYGKLVNCCADLPSAALAGTSVFKAITGGDYIQGEYKFKDSFSFRPFCKLIFSANRMPQSPDDSDGFFRRWLVVPFDQRFAKDAPGTISQDVLLAKLTTANELSGVLNHALRAGDGLRSRRHFTKTATIDLATVEFRRATDPFAVWLEENTELAPEGYIPQIPFRDKYQESCKKDGRAIPSPMALTAMLKGIHPNLELKQKKMNPTELLKNGVKGTTAPWCYFGIAWKEQKSSAANSVDGSNQDQGGSYLDDDE